MERNYKKYFAKEYIKIYFSNPLGKREGNNTFSGILLQTRLFIRNVSCSIGL